MSYAIIQMGDFSPNSGEPSSGEMADITAEIVKAHIARTYKRMRGGLKILARHARVSPNTAKTWYDGKGYPHGDRLMRVCKHSVRLQMELHDRCNKMREEEGNTESVDAFYEV